MASYNSDDEEQARLIVPPEGEVVDSIDAYTYPILDDELYNIIHDIVLKVHRDERIAKANTAAILIEQEAAEAFPDEPPTPSKSSKQKHHSPKRLENDAAIYEDGLVTIKGNPLATIHEIRCPKCGLPKLLHPTDGNGARKPEPGVEYCKRHPYIDKPGHDIYGLPFPKDDSASNRKSKPKGPNLLASSGSQLDGPDSSFDSADPSPSPAPAEPVTFPTTLCPRCPRYINIKVFARHLNLHNKGGGRASGRAAIMKINGQSGVTPPASRRSTPNVKLSPQKRSLEDLEDVNYNDDDDADDGESPKKKARVPTLKVNPKKKLNNGVGVVKKWKSGKITVDGKTVDPRPGLGTAGGNKKGKAVQRGGSDSSHTLESP
ncbi:hypothetical protein V493_03884 [Pseudogymnoascus sp. VKM F-4281 (FW-2241)]|nr:hypothetical protein V493_03884 [Pseudogymnoascus sp. VKM F-4281 (FW-2241)]